MADDDALPDLLRAYSAGDADVQKDVLARVEQSLKGIVRGQMGAKLRSLEESVDLTQSLMLAFHMAASSGKVELPNEAALHGYLKAMVRHKLANRADAANAAKRGGGKLPASLDQKLEDEASLPLPADDDLRASVIVRVKETKERIESEISEEEQIILEGRLLGRTDAEIARDLNKTPDAVRMIWQRARMRLVDRSILRDGE